MTPVPLIERDAGFRNALVPEGHAPVISATLDLGAPATEHQQRGDQISACRAYIHIPAG